MGKANRYITEKDQFPGQGVLFGPPLKAADPDVGDYWWNQRADDAADAASAPTSKTLGQAAAEAA